MHRITADERAHLVQLLESIHGLDKVLYTLLMRLKGQDDHEKATNGGSGTSHCYCILLELNILTAPVPQRVAHCLAMITHPYNSKPRNKVRTSFTLLPVQYAKQNLVSTLSRAF